MTALAATALPGSALLPPRVLLQVTGAPNPPAGGYTANFTASADSWTASGTGVNATLWTAGDTYLTLQSTLTTGTVGNVITAARVVTGLTIGAVYKVRVTVTRSSANAGNTRVRVTGSTTGSYVAVPVGANTVLEVTFTATATSHTVNVDQQRSVTFEAERVFIVAATVAPVGTWQGTTIRRTDANGTSVVVREDQGGQDTAGGTMTLTDFEAALLGPIGYAVTDGNGVVTYASTTHSAGARVNLCPNPSFESGVLAPFVPFASSAAFITTARAHTGRTSVQVNFPTAAALATGFGAWTVTGLTVGATYTFSAWLYVPAASLACGPTVRVSGLASGNVVTVADTWVRSSVTFAATATSHNFHPVTTANAVTAGMVCYVDDVQLETGTGSAYFDGSTPSTTELHGWLGAPLASASMATSNAETAAGVWLTIPASAVPSAGTIPNLGVDLVLSYEESSESNGSLHKIIGRADPIANPGPLALRAGTLELYAKNYPTADAVRALLAAGDVAQLRQPTHPGLDLYFVAQDVRVTPDDADTDPRRWVAAVTYAEVLPA